MAAPLWTSQSMHKDGQSDDDVGSRCTRWMAWASSTSKKKGREWQDQPHHQEQEEGDDLPKIVRVGKRRPNANDGVGQHEPPLLFHGDLVEGRRNKVDNEAATLLPALASHDRT